MPNLRKELSKHSNSFNHEVSSQIVQEDDGEENLPRPAIVSHITDPTRVIQRVIHKRGIVDPLICFSCDKGDNKVVMVCQAHDLARQEPNRYNGFSTGGSRLTFMLYCGY